MKFLDELKKVLISDERFFGEANQIIKTKVSDAARANDGKLLKALLNNDLLKEAFFTKVDDIYVFDKNRFVWVLESKEFLPDSFTMYKNKTGLIDSNNNLISQKQDVSLVWPYKDCVLEGGQTKEDQKRDEIFYNETLAPDQVNRLLAPKVLGNAKRYTKDGLEENIKFREDDNLIIKGNNLIALTSLLERYEGQVKCIYIDPPYNTGSDSFGYNDYFNHSTWLTFMKNRLELSYRLLSDNGCIWINIDDDESHYLKVLCDEIFDRENFIANVIWEKKHTRSNDARYFSDNHDHIIIYAKSKSSWKINRLPRTEDMDSAYTNPDNDPRGSWQSMPLQAKSGSEHLAHGKFIHKFPNSIEWTPPQGRYSAFSHETLDKMYENGMIWFGVDGSNVPRYKKYLSDLTEGVVPKTIWTHKEVGHNQDSRKEVSDIIGSGKFDTPKPEKLLERILHIGSGENDLVLDFFMGSATTQAVAMKMNRRFIGVEQMDYINTVSVPRLEKVIEGEQGGISKSVNWQGGGSFVYCELLEDNESLVNELEKAENTDQVKIVLNKAIDNGKLIPSVLPNDLKENQDDFDKLSLDDQKNLVMELLNKNQLYVNLSDVDDEDYMVSVADKAFTRSFYGKE